MRFLELELQETLDLAALQLKNVASFSTPRAGLDYILDLPPEGPRLLRRGDAWGEIPLDGLTPRLLADTADGEVLVVGRGAKHNATLLSRTGGKVRSFQLGEGVADLTFDPDGNLLVLRRNPPLLLRFGPDGDRVLSDPAVEQILESTKEKDGWMLLVQNDGAIWINLSEKYDAEGKALLTLDPAKQFGTGRVCADLLGWDGIVVLNEAGNLTAVRGNQSRPVKVPEAVVRKSLGRTLTATSDLLTTRDEQMAVLATDRNLLLRFRILSE